MNNLSPAPLPHFNDEKKGVLVCVRTHHWYVGEGGFISQFILSKIAISVKTNEKFEPSFPQISMMKKKRVLVCARTHQFILSKIVDTK